MIDVSATDDDGRTVLHRETENVEEYIRLGADVNARDQGNWTPLMCASSAGHTEKVRALLSSKSIEVNLTNDSGMTALHYAASRGRLEILSLLLQRDDLRLDVQDVHSKLTPLMRAVIGNQPLCVQKLIQAGARVNLTDVEGNTALHHAVIEGREDLAVLLAEAGTDLDIRNKAGEVALRRASPRLLYTLGILE